MRGERRRIWKSKRRKRGKDGTEKFENSVERGSKPRVNLEPRERGEGWLLRKAVNSLFVSRSERSNISRFVQGMLQWAEKAEETKEVRKLLEETFRGLPLLEKLPHRGLPCVSCAYVCSFSELPTVYLYTEEAIAISHEFGQRRCKDRSPAKPLSQVETFCPRAGLCSYPRVLNSWISSFHGASPIATSIRHYTNSVFSPHRVSSRDWE